jgi:poly-gamma-glutamate synthesis protein (capsule biosynthesis protein)
MKIKSNRHIYTKIIIFSLTISTIAGVLGFVYLNKQNTPNKHENSRLNKTKQEPKVSTIRMIASGDEIAHDSINKYAKTANGWDYTQFFTNMKPVFDKADIRFCNLEIPTAAPEAGAISGYPVFNAPSEFSRDLSKTGCNVINTATNHANDKHQAGIDATLRIWDGLPKLAIAGTNRSLEDQQKVQYFSVKGVKFAFLAYNYQSNDSNKTTYAVNMFDEELMKKQLKEAQDQKAYIIVSVHWGTEDSEVIDSAQEKWSSFLAENGADVVIGTGPHVIEPVKKIPKSSGGETLVWYSIGNLLSTQLKVEELVGGFAVMDFEVKDNKPLMKDIGFLPTYMHYEWTPAEAAAQDLLARKNIKLCLLDQAAEPLAMSQNKTSVEIQTERVQKLLNTYTNVPILTSKKYNNL